MKNIYLSLTAAMASILIFSGSTCVDDAALMAPTNKLHRAAKYNDLREIEEALRWGYRVDERDELQHTALHFAASYGKPEATRLLLERGAYPNAKNSSGRTPLHIASPQSRGMIFDRRYIETMSVLLAYGADINAMDAYGDTPLHRSTFWLIEENVEFLLSRGANRFIRNYRGQTAFDVASDTFRYEESLTSDCVRRADSSCGLDSLHRAERIMNLLR